jgi:cellulose biosynthesis protein BcsQ
LGLGTVKLDQGQSIFVGNIKGGVGKSTLTTLLFDYFQNKKDRTRVQMVDADRQGTSFELLEALANSSDVRHVPVADSLTIVDTGAGWPGNVWQLAMMAECIIIPTTLSWADLRPTIEFVQEMDERKESLDTLSPHLIIVPNKVPPAQRDMSMLSDNLKDLNVVVSPPLSDLSIVRHMSSDFKGLAATKGTRFYDEFIRLGDFIDEYVLSGRLSKMYE